MYLITTFERDNIMSSDDYNVILDQAMKNQNQNTHVCITLHVLLIRLREYRSNYVLQSQFSNIC